MPLEPRRVGDLAVLDRHVEIGAHDDALALQVEPPRSSSASRDPCVSSFLQEARARSRPSCPAVMPKCSNSLGAGAEAPKSLMPTNCRCRRSSRSQPCRRRPRRRRAAPSPAPARGSFPAGREQLQHGIDTTAACTPSLASVSAASTARPTSEPVASSVTSRLPSGSRQHVGALGAQVLGRRRLAQRSAPPAASAPGWTAFASCCSASSQHSAVSTASAGRNT